MVVRDESCSSHSGFLRYDAVLLDIDGTLVDSNEILPDEVSTANDNRRPDSVVEEASAMGERAKGTAKDAAGAVLGNDRLEREG